MTDLVERLPYAVVEASSLGNTKSVLNRIKDVKIASGRDRTIDHYLETRFTYVNGTDEDFTVVLRNGVRQVVKRTEYCERNNDGFYVLVEHITQRDAMVEACELTKRNPAQGAEKRAWTAQLREAGEGLREGSINGRYRDKHQALADRPTQQVLYSYFKDQFKGKQKVFYLEDLDILIIRGVDDGTIEHPHSARKRAERGVEKYFPWSTERAFGLMLKIVNNNADPYITDRWINLGGHVYRIPAGPEPGLGEDGVYIFAPNEYVSEDRLTPVEREERRLEGSHLTRGTPHFMPIREADQYFDLHRTAEDAHAHGNRIEKLRLELEEAKLEAAKVSARLKVKEHELEDRKITHQIQEEPKVRKEAEEAREHQTKVIQEERVIRKEENELKKQTLAVTSQKVVHESRIAPWRSVTEWFKTIAAVAGAVVTAVAVWQKFFTTK